jgi:hypothetical protein
MKWKSWDGALLPIRKNPLLFYVVYNSGGATLQDPNPVAVFVHNKLTLTCHVCNTECTAIRSSKGIQISILPYFVLVYCVCYCVTYFNSHGEKYIYFMHVYIICEVYTVKINTSYCLLLFFNCRKSSWSLTTPNCT